MLRCPEDTLALVDFTLDRETAALYRVMIDVEDRDGVRPWLDALEHAGFDATLTAGARKNVEFGKAFDATSASGVSLGLRSGLFGTWSISAVVMR